MGSATDTVSAAGVEIPVLGFGTWELEGDDAVEAVSDALEIGYRHIDTARAYGNEEQVGRAIGEADLEREEIFLTTKLWFDDLSPEGVRSQAAGSLEKLDTDYVDLLLIHWPDPETDLGATLEAMAELHREGRVRALGVSNFPTRELAAARHASPVPLAANQVEFHPYLDQTPILDAVEGAGMAMEAYSPLAHGEIPDDETLVEIGETHGKTAAQVTIRWLLDHDPVVVLPRSSSPERRRENFEVFDFELSEDERRRIDALARPDGRQIDPDFAPDWD